METEINIRKIGKLRIYLKAGERVPAKNRISSLFSKTVYWNLMREAKKDNIMQAHVFYTNISHRRGEGIHHTTAEGDHSGLTVCLELVDEKEKLELFFKTHASVFKGKTVIYKEVEFWSLEA